MLTKIVARNIRLFRGDWTFDLKPLTVICGSNSSGKSTLLKLPLLLKQSMESPIDNPLDGALRLNGPNVDLGTFRTLASDEDESKTIGIGIEIRDRIPIRSINRMRGRRISAEPPKKARMANYRFLTTLEFQEARHLVGRRAQRGLTPRGVPVLSKGRFLMSSEGQPLLEWPIERAGKQATDNDTRDEFQVRFPRKYLRRAAERGAPAVGVAEGSDLRFGAHLAGILPFVLVAQRTRGAESESDPRQFHLPFPPEAAGALTDLRVQLELLRYVGPLRAPARRYYTSDTRDPTRPDSTGEGVPFILREQLGRVISFVPPGSTKSRRTTLGVASGLWLHFLRTGEAPAERVQEIAVTSVRDVAVEIRLRSNDSSGLHALIDSGFGYSQVLPILVQCLLSSPGATILIEQPELHLNPALVVRLAEFFVAVTRSGRQVVLETHSEHLVNALRVLSAEDETGLLHDDIGITYLDYQSGKLTKTDLSVQEDGSVPDWPMPFFGEALFLSSRLLSAQKRFLKPRA